jgi:transposase
MGNYFLGSDVSKGYADFILLNENRKIVIPNFQLDDTFEGHNKLYNVLSQFFQDHPNAVIYAGVESTGGYENNWFNSMHKFQSDFNIKVAKLNPTGVNHNSKADMKRVITDKVAAISISEYLISHPEKVSYQTEDYFSSLKRQWTFVKMLVKQKAQLLNQLESMVYTANPDILAYCRDGVPQWVLKLLRLYPTAKSLAEASVSSLVSIPYVTEHLAIKLIENAKKSVASAVDSVTENIVQSLSAEILHLEELVKMQTKLMAEHCSLPEIDLLKTFKSIGDFSAIGLLIEIGPIERFASVKKLASFFGLHPKFKMSGDGLWGIHMSKEGRSAPRAILFMVTLSAIVHNPLIKEIYMLNLKKGKDKMDAIGVCMHKILRIIYGMLKNNAPFDPEIDRKNREKSPAKKKTEVRDSKRRYQTLDASAPISRRQSKKREEREQSQSEKLTKLEISAPAPLVVGD